MNYFIICEALTEDFASLAFRHLPVLPNHAPLQAEYLLSDMHGQCLNLSVNLQVKAALAIQL